MSDREYLPHSTGCFLCGDENEKGVRTTFFVEGDEVVARLALPSHLNGYKGVAHGGILAALLDETMGWAATVFSREHPMYVTGEITVRYLAPVPVGEEIAVRSRLVREGGRLAASEGVVTFGGKVCVRARGKFLAMDRKGTEEVIPYLKFDRCRRYRNLLRGDGSPGE